jgi:hypothetical protein
MCQSAWRHPVFKAFMLIVHYNGELDEEEFQTLIIVALSKVQLKILNPVKYFITNRFNP